MNKQAQTNTNKNKQTNKQINKKISKQADKQTNKQTKNKQKQSNMQKHKQNIIKTKQTNEYTQTNGCTKLDGLGPVDNRPSTD